MSIEIMAQVWAKSEQKGSSLLALLAIADSADSRGICWPSINHLAKKIRMSRRQAIRIIRGLEIDGELATRRRQKDGRNSSNIYQINDKYIVDKMSPPSDKMSPPSDAHVTTLVTPMSLPSDTYVTRGSDIAMSPDPSYRSTNEPPMKREEGSAPPNGFWGIPPEIKTPEFVSAWADWLRYVDEGGLRFTEIQAGRTLARLAAAGIDTAVSSVNRAIDRGWKNIYIDDEEPAANGQAIPGLQAINGVY